MKKQSKLLLLILGSILIFSGCTAKRKETASIKKEIPQAAKKENIEAKKISQQAKPSQTPKKETRQTRKNPKPIRNTETKKQNKKTGGVITYYFYCYNGEENNPIDGFAFIHSISRSYQNDKDKAKIDQATKKEMEQWVNDNQGYIADTMTRKYAGDLWKGLGLITKRKYTGSKLWKPLPKKN